MDTRDADPLRRAFDPYVNVPRNGKRQLVLGDLVRFRKVRIEVVLPRKDAFSLHRARSGDRRPDGELDNLAVENGEDSRHAGAHGACVLVGRRAEGGGA
jgi:hypothetical protein